MIIKDAAIITARTSSKRLPDKTIMKINGKNTIDFTIERAKKTGYPVILATSNDKSDDILEEIAKEHDIHIFRGSLPNKIKRCHDCFNEFSINNALLIEGADIGYDYDIAKRSMNKLKKTNSDIIWCPEEIITGLFTLAMNKSGIKELYSFVLDENEDTDVFTHLFKKMNANVDFIELNENEKNEEIRLTIDYKEDLEFFRKLYNRFSSTEKSSTMIEYLIQNPSLTKINYFREKDYLDNKKKFMMNFHNS